MVQGLAKEERFDRQLIKETIKQCIEEYDAERQINPNITSGEMTNRLFIKGLTMAEVVEVYNYFYNGGYPDYEGYDYGLW